MSLQSVIFSRFDRIFFYLSERHRSPKNTANENKKDACKRRANRHFSNAESYTVLQVRWLSFSGRRCYEPRLIHVQR